MCYLLINHTVNTLYKICIKMYNHLFGANDRDTIILQAIIQQLMYHEEENNFNDDCALLLGSTAINRSHGSKSFI